MPLLRRKEIRPDPMTDGCHAVKIIRAESKTSQSGNEMIRVIREYLLSGEVTRTTIVFSHKSGFAIDAAFKSLNLIMPDDEFVADRKHFEGRTGFIRTVEEESEEFGVQTRVRWISKKAAVKDDPRLAEIPESEPLTLPVIASGAVPTSKPRSVPRVQSSWTKEEEGKRRQAAEAAANELHLHDALAMGPSESSVTT